MCHGPVDAHLPVSRIPAGSRKEALRKSVRGDDGLKSLRFPLTVTSVGARASELGHIDLP